MDESIMRLGVAINELSEEELKELIKSVLKEQKCENCGFVMTNSREVKNTIETLKNKAEDLKKRFNTLSFNIICENYFKVDENRKFKCDYSKTLNWDNLNSFLVTEDCPKCKGKLVATALLMRIEGMSVTLYCPKCLREKKSSKIMRVA